MASRKVTVTMARPNTAERSGNVVRRQVGTPSCRIRKNSRYSVAKRYLSCRLVHAAATSYVFSRYGTG